MGTKRSKSSAAAPRSYPFLVAQPVPLSEHLAELRALEETHWFTNFGPAALKFEKAFVRSLFKGEGSCTTVGNATLGLMLSIRARMIEASGPRERARRTAVIMPSFTFPATAHAALWNGLSVVFCDIDSETWLPSERSLNRLLSKLGSRVAAIVPYATFGNNLDLGWYESLEKKHGIPVVVDAAASVGSQTPDGRHFGHGSSLPIIFSMHATKLLATSEGGVVYSSDSAHIRSVRAMSNFGFDENRIVTLPGLNAKLPEIGALQGLLKLREMGRLVRSRDRLARRYQQLLPAFTFQRQVGTPAFPFLAARIDGSARDRDALIAAAAARGVELRKYYNPPLHRQKFFAARPGTDLPNTDRIADQIVTLPLYDSLTADDVDAIAGVVRESAS